MGQPAWITGCGAISPIGVGVPSFTRALRDGRSGMRELPFRDPRIRSRSAATCAEFDPESAMSAADVRRLPRLAPMALAAAREAMAQSGLDPTGEAAGRVGLILGTGGGGIDFTIAQASAVNAGRAPSLWTITNATHGNLAGELSIRLGLHGPSYCVSDGCASSSDAVGLARDLVTSSRPGAPEACVVVGADAHVCVETLWGMELLGVVSTADRAPERASRPFDAHRDGFILGEGAWAIVLERASAATDRGAVHLGAVVGYGATCDAFHRVRPAPDMRECARAIRLALQDAGLAPDRVGAVHYHGTATALNDALETQAVKLALGEHARRVPGSSVKSMIGHPQGACGLAALVATLAALNDPDPFIPPTINLETPDPACDLDYTPGHAVRTDARYALINCLAFGAKNSAIVIEKAWAR